MTKKILLFCVAFILFTGRIFGNIDGSELSAVTDSYIPGETNTFIFRCDVVSPDAEWMHTVKVQYNPNMIVTAGFDSKGNQGNLIFIGYTGDGALSIWESDNGPDFGAISDKNSAFFSNTVFVTSAVTGDIVLTYYLLGDNYGIAPHSLTNTITLKQYKPSTIDSAALVSPSTINIDSYNFTPEITACLFIDGKTGTSGPAPEITAEIGVGVSGTTPDNSWEWQSTVYVGTDGTNDIFRTNLFVTVAGNQDYAVRFKQADEEWLVCDLDGGTNGYSPAQAGQMTANFLASVGDLQHEQTLQSSWVGTVVSFTNGAGENIIVADDVIFQVDTVVQTIRWKGMYRNDHKRDGIEDGFLFQIWEDDAGKPGTLFYSCFQPGYACEKVVNDLLFYQMILTNDLNLSGDTKYWWGIQMHTPGTAWWDISDTSDTPIGSLPMVKSTYFFVDDSWHADQVTFDLGVEFYGGFESDVYIKPQVQSGKGMVGSNVVYNLSILNKTGSDETFYLSDNSPWTATFPPNTGVIPNGASNNVSIVIDIPFDAANGTVVTSVITVAGSSKTNSAMLITEARWEYNVFSETFDAWPPEGWTNYFLADSTNGWEDWGAGNPPRCIRHPTIETLSSNWFVSPAINLQNISIAEKLQLTYDESMWGTSDYTYSSVMISSGDRNPANGDYVQLYEMIPIDQGYFWETIKMDILKYLGSNPVYIAFLYVGTNGHRPYVDNVCVKTGKISIDSSELISPAVKVLNSYQEIQTTGSVFLAGNSGPFGPLPNMETQFGFGPKNSKPNLKSYEWTWFDADYTGSNATHDIYSRKALVTCAGELDCAYRFKQGSESWTFADLDSSSNGYSSAAAGKLHVEFPTPKGTLQYSQTLPDAWMGTGTSFKNGNDYDIITADDFTPTAHITIQSVRWKGRYRDTHPREGAEEGFWLYIYDNDGTHPGNILYSQFHEGFSSEMLSNDLYQYQIDLTNDFHAGIGTTYWFAVQMVAPGDTWWGISMTPDEIEGSKPVIWGPKFYNSTNWVHDIFDSDFGFEFFGIQEFVPEINLKGNGQNILNGDSSPTTADGTDFGTAVFDSEVITNSFVIENLGFAHLNISNLFLTMGAPEFAVVTSVMDSVILPGTSTVFQIVFAPTSESSFFGILNIANSDSDENPYTFAISGEGVPEGGFYLLFIIGNFFFIFLRKNKK